MFKRLIPTLIAVSLIIPTKCFAGDKYNFTYSDGDTPWLRHIPTEINSTYKAALEETPHLKRLICTGDNTEGNNNPFHGIEPICLQGGGAKMVIPRGYPDFDHYVFLSPVEGGLFEQEHMVRGLHLDFYQPSGPLLTKYFLANFNWYEIPTCFPKETEDYLPLWQSLFRERNNMSREYFDEHIRVTATTIEMREWKGRADRRFTIEFYYCIDWTHIKLSDCICINHDYDKIKELAGKILESDDIHYPGLWSERDSLGLGLSLSRIVPVDHIAGKDEVRRAVSDASPLLAIDVNRGLRLDRDGRMILVMYGIVDESQNKCLRATIDLEKAQVSDLEPTPCRIY